MCVNLTAWVRQRLGRPLVMLFTIGTFLASVSVFGQVSSRTRAGSGMTGPSPAYWNAVAAQDALNQSPPVDQRRFINGQWTLCTLPGWVRFYGTFDFPTTNGGLVIDGGCKGDTSINGSFVLVHFPHDVATGDKFKYDAEKSWWAKPSGTIPVIMKDGIVHILHRLDYGALNAPQVAPVVLTSDQLAAAKEAAAKKKVENAAKALAYNLKAADAGDSYGEYRMGQRYRDGEGVAKDLRQSREWFAKAAAQGDKLAKEELAALSQN